jgi:hypothetical protein
MNSATLAVSAKPSTFEGLGRALRSAVQRISWRVVGATLAIAVALEAWLVFEIAVGPKLPAAEGYVSGAIINLLMAFSIMFTTLVADERVARGAKRLPAYAWAVVIGSAAAALAQWGVHEWLHLRTQIDIPGIPHEVSIMQPAKIFFEYLIWGSIIVFIYVNRRTALLAAARMNAAQVQRADAQRRTLESRLQALQARVEPQFLFNTLAQVRALYESDPAKGSQMLGDLIVYLRAALPQLRDSASTLEQELKLVGAYLSIMQVHRGERLAFAIDAPPTVLAARMQPMILLPLIDLVLVGELAVPAEKAIRLAARREDGRLRVELSGAGGPIIGADSGSLLRDIRERLHALYGDRGSLALESSGNPGMGMVLDIPYEPTHGAHR